MWEACPWFARGRRVGEQGAAMKTRSLGSSQVLAAVAIFAACSKSSPPDPVPTPATSSSTVAGQTSGVPNRTDSAPTTSAMASGSASATAAPSRPQADPTVGAPCPSVGTSGPPSGATVQPAGGGDPNTLPPAATDAPDINAPVRDGSPPDAELVAARKNKNDPNLIFLTYQHLDQLFDTRVTRAGGKTWELPRSARSLPANFSFMSNGQNTTLAKFMVDARMNALLVLKDGEIVSEIYRHGSDVNTRFTAMSMSKSFISAMYGIAIQDGLIKSVDEPLVTYLPELKSSAYANATIKNLLMMRAGNSWSENGDGLGSQRTLSLDEEKVYYEDFAFQVTPTSMPGSTFNYSTLDSCVLGWALESAIGRNLADYVSERLWVPAGMQRDGYWMMQGPNGKQREFFGAGLNATLRDMGRFGQLMLEGGMHDGVQIVPKEWVAESTSRGTPPAPYMYQWWAGENDADFSAIGHGGQTINVDPVNHTVIVILSYYDPGPPMGLQAPLLRAIKGALK